jgi:hypothetical protein
MRHIEPGKKNDPPSPKWHGKFRFAHADCDPPPRDYPKLRRALARRTRNSYVTTNSVQGLSMAPAGFAVVHARSDGEAHTVDAPLIHCFDGKQVVLAFVSRTALADYFRLPRRPTMRESNLVVDRNIEAFARIVTAKYQRGTTSIYEGFGQSFPRVDVTFEDMQHSGEEFTGEVLRLEAAFHWTTA